ncbi:MULTISPECIES: hypothetical protein [Ensifer]|uniref:Uncharacterized protein n=1 Tax=Ensifer oleiphilus TaxID=2742698 RepID=A0A7Y6UMG1_9HYPH|nr:MULTISPECIES: hypothetical protein [Ensifer]NVD39376.1 hypothetical protein [Ensifer oleiphilus]OCP17467.1 hypothetical protein BC361_08410 [Ensifer sp. LC54]OCP28627.1 hypothetical protein BC363_01945 [Ensifer sp. LC384]
MLNRFDQKALYEACMHVCTIAVRDGFPHLSAADILDPPHQWFDAALARQIVMHLMIRECGWPKRRVVEVEERSREAINRALRTVDARMKHPRFANHYQTIKTQARSLLTMIASEEEAA